MAMAPQEISCIGNFSAAFFLNLEVKNAGFMERMVFNWRGIRVLDAGGIRNGGDRFHTCEKRRKHHHEELDGLLYRNCNVVPDWCINDAFFH
jgi:hypothetical protein